MMTLFAIIYLLLMCYVVYTLYKNYDELTGGIDSRKNRIMFNVVAILLAPVVWVIGIITYIKEDLKK